MIESMSAETFHNLRHAVEVGKWPDGKVLSPEQRHNALQAVIAWGEQHLPAHERVGFIDKGRKADASGDDAQPQALNWKD